MKKLIGMLGVVGASTLGVSAASAHSIEVKDSHVERTLTRKVTPTVTPKVVAVPQIAVEGCGQACSVEADVPAVLATTPTVADQAVETPPVALDETCAGMLACVGSFEVAGIGVAHTPAVGSESVTTPALNLPATCQLAGVLCNGVSLAGWTVTYTPQINGVAANPPLQLVIEATDWQFTAADHVGETWHLQPIELRPYLAGVGTVPITLFPRGLDLPFVPNAGVVGDITLSLLVGAQHFTQTVPVSIAA